MISSLSLNLFDANECVLPPLRYSSGKTQLDLIEEIMNAFDSNDVVFLKAVVGSGKSIVGIRTILTHGRGVISVPTKHLSNQYKADYEGKKFFKKDNGEIAGIKILKGRRNFECLYRKCKCDKKNLPCTKPLRRGGSRIDALQDCPHWGFIFPSRWGDSTKNAEVIGMPYQGIKGNWLWCMRGECPYWKQFQAYLVSDAIVMNSAKWAAEVSIGRIPQVPITVIDEADDWLDSLGVKVVFTEKMIDGIINKIIGPEQASLERARRSDLAREVEDTLQGLWSIAIRGANPFALVDYLLEQFTGDEEFERLFWKLKTIQSHRNHVEVEILKDKIVYVIPDPKIVLEEIRGKVGGRWLLMSATVQSEDVLHDVFGLTPTFVEGETRFPGTIIQKRVGGEEIISHKRWINDPTFRERYWMRLRECKLNVPRPTLVNVHTPKYLGIDKNSHSPIIQDVIDAKEKEFLEKKEGIIWTTRMDRGLDLKWVRGIIFTKYPNPNLGDPLLIAMKRKFGDGIFWNYYNDIGRRTFIQSIGRVIRSDDDVVEFWSPDENCHRKLKLWSGHVIKE